MRAFKPADPNKMAEQNFTIYHKAFAALNPYELYAIIRLRNEVFVVEQACVFQDADNKDPHCHHLLVWDNDQLVAYARLLPEGLMYEEMSIGRIVSSPVYRGTGAGKLLVSRAIDACKALFGEAPIRIGAQLYLTGFYASFGFRQTGEVYLEDGIRHIEMIKEK
jgi:ElaA protein